MSIHKTQNPILVIATLGVYFGLILAGATPQVLANAAMTRQFDVNDEIEVKDDLDKKPDDCSDGMSEQAKQLLNLSVLSRGVIGYVTDIQQLVRIGKLGRNEGIKLSFKKKSFGGIGEVSYERTSQNRWFELAASENLNAITDLLCPWSGCKYYRYDPDSDKDASITNVLFTLDGQDLVIKITTEQKDSADAGKLASIYQETFKIGGCSDDYATLEEQTVYKNTKVSSSNNQVLIVTRLPRGSLDSLLATNAK